MEKNYTFENGNTFSVSAGNRRANHSRFVTTYQGNPTHYTYKITIEYKGKSESFTFHDSIYNYQNKKGATEEMIDNALECLIDDYYAYLNCNNVGEFADEFGYDYLDDKRRVNRIWKLLGENWDKLDNLFTEEEASEIEQKTRRNLW
jgi:hypothetical protein